MIINVVSLLFDSKPNCVQICCSWPLLLLIPGVREKQAAERRSHSEVQAEEDGEVSGAEQKDQERTAQPEPPNGISASEDPET